MTEAGLQSRVLYNGKHTCYNSIMIGMTIFMQKGQQDGNLLDINIREYSSTFYFYIINNISFYAIINLFIYITNYILNLMCI